MQQVLSGGWFQRLRQLHPRLCRAAGPFDRAQTAKGRTEFDAEFGEAIIDRRFSAHFAHASDAVGAPRRLVRTFRRRSRSAATRRQSSRPRTPARRTTAPRCHSAAGVPRPAIASLLPRAAAMSAAAAWQSRPDAAVHSSRHGRLPLPASQAPPPPEPAAGRICDGRRTTSTRHLTHPGISGRRPGCRDATPEQRMHLLCNIR